MPRKKPPAKLKKTPNRKPILNILLIVGVVAISITILIFKNQDQPAETVVAESAAPQETLEEKLDRLLEEGEPIFLFFHSNNCHSCIVMVETVTQVFPDYMNEVALLDIDVYDESNQSILRRAGITTIPTQIFIDRNGQGQTVLGTMESDILRDHLSQIIKGK